MFLREANLLYVQAGQSQNWDAALVLDSRELSSKLVVLREKLRCVIPPLFQVFRVQTWSFPALYDPLNENATVV